MGGRRTRRQTISIYWQSLICASFFILSGCDLGKTSFGGTTDLNSSSSAEALLSSSSLLAQIEPISATTVGGYFTSIANRASGSPGDFQLLPDVSTLGLMNAEWMRILPSAASTFFSSSFNSTVYLNTPTVLVVMETGSRGDVISINPGDRANGAFQIRATPTTIEAAYLASTTDQELVTETKPSDSKLLVAASFGTQANTTLLSINGSLSDGFSTVGSPIAPSSSYHLIQLGSSTAANTFDFKRMYVFSRPLTASELGSVITYVANLEGMSITLDPRLGYTGPASQPSDPLFTAARNVIRSRCLNCHSEWANLSASGFVGLGLVSPGSPLSSKLYYRLTGSQGGGGPKTMPQSGSISASEIDQISAWISGLQ
jgi:hypothetical protein